jgi:hypothetical protein
MEGRRERGIAKTDRPCSSPPPPSSSPQPLAQRCLPAAIASFGIRGPRTAAARALTPPAVPAQGLPRPRPDEEVLAELRARRPTAEFLSPEVLAELHSRRLRRAASGRPGLSSRTLAEEDGEGEGADADAPPTPAGESPTPPAEAAEAPALAPLHGLPLSALPINANAAAEAAAQDPPPPAAVKAAQSSRIGRAPPPARGRTDKENRLAAAGGA